MDIGKRITKAQERYDRQEVNRLLALELPEAIEQLPYLSGRGQSLYLRLLPTEKLVELAKRIFREDAARGLGIDESELTEEQIQAWCRAQGYPQAEASRATGPSFDTD